MSSIERWLAGITGLAIVATVFSNKNSPNVIKAGFSGIASVYTAAKKA